MSKLTYDDLKLGEKAKEAFLRGESLKKIEETCPIYLNTKEVYKGLNTTDLAIAGVLSGMNILLVGDRGCGKSQLANDIRNYYFGGPKNEGGQGLTVEGHSELDLMNEYLTKINLEEGKRELNGNHEALFWNLEEFNRCPPIIQNQFYTIGNGRLTINGTTLPIGKEGYVSSIATANIGNGDFQGTFDTDNALMNRFGVVIDFDYEKFQPDVKDIGLIKRLIAANPNIKEAPMRDISDLVINASKKISSMTQNPGLEALAVANFLELGLENCEQAGGKKGKIWPYSCQECPKNTDGKYLCSLVERPPVRTTQAMIKYAAALNYLAKLKNPNIELDPVDLMFKSFELTSAYQNILNPGVLKQEYQDQNPNMMGEVVGKLKKDFKDNEDVILTTLDASEKGVKRSDYFEHSGETHLGYNDLDEESRQKVRKVDPFNDRRAIGLSWVEDIAEQNIEIYEARKNCKK